jgi:hypothetical protein
LVLNIVPGFEDVTLASTIVVATGSQTLPIVFEVVGEEVAEFDVEEAEEVSAVDDADEVDEEELAKDLPVLLRVDLVEERVEHLELRLAQVLELIWLVLH